MYALLYAQPLWLHDGGIGVAATLWIYWGIRSWRNMRGWQRAAYGLSGALLAYYETGPQMTWYWAAIGFALLGLVLITEWRQQGRRNA